MRIGVRPGQDTIAARLEAARKINHDLRNSMLAASLRGSALRRRGKAAAAELHAANAELTATVVALRGKVRAA